jgi:hypothetical protein
MTHDPRCRQVEALLDEAFLARREVGDSEADHIEGCPRCATRRHELSRVGKVLSAPVAELGAARAQAILDSARAALGETPHPILSNPAGARPALPPGFARELVRLLGFTALPLPLLAIGYAGLAQAGGALLGDLLPGFLAPAAGFVIAISAASWLGLVYGALPFVAHHRALRRAFRHDEVIA